MNVQSMVVIEIERNGRLYTFSMPVGAPYGEAYDAAFEALQSVLDMARQSAERARPVEVDNETAAAE